MFVNTGTTSFILYGVFILITLIAMVLAFRFINNGNIDPSKLDKMIDLFKYTIVSVAIATVTLIISNLFKEREQDINELEYFDRYVNDVKKVDGIQERLQLAKYLSIVAPSGELKKSWMQYYDSTKVEYKEYLKLKKEERRLDTITNPTREQIIKKESIQEEIKTKEAPLVSQTTNVPNDYETAKALEEQGFEYLLKKDYANALSAFSNSEKAYNMYHQVYEISRFLRQNKTNLTDPNSASWKEAYLKIANDFSYGMPERIKNQLLINSK